MTRPTSRSPRALFLATLALVGVAHAEEGLTDLPAEAPTVAAADSRPAAETPAPEAAEAAAPTRPENVESSASAAPRGGAYAGQHGVFISGDVQARGIDPTAVRDVVNRELDEVQTCYGGLLSRRPDLSGELVMKMIIDDAGEVSRVVGASRDLRYDQGGVTDMLRCIEDAFASLTFPPAERNRSALVVVPLRLQNDGALARGGE